MKATQLLVLLSLSACAHAVETSKPATRPTVPNRPAERSNAPSCSVRDPAATPAERIAKHGTVLDQYHRQDGIWLPNAPVLINEDFDFALAMSVEDGLGAGLAAAKRKNANEQRAQALAALRFGDALTERLAELGCCGKQVYFLSWGSEGKIKMVVDDATEPQIKDWSGPEGAVEIEQAARELVNDLACDTGTSGS